MVAFSEVQNLNFRYKIVFLGSHEKICSFSRGPGEVPLNSYKFRGFNSAKAAASAMEGRV